MSKGCLKRPRSPSPARTDENVKRQAVASWVSSVDEYSTETILPAAEPSETWDGRDEISMGDSSKLSSKKANTKDGESSEMKTKPTEIDYEPTLRALRVMNADEQSIRPAPQNWQQLRDVMRRVRDSPEASPQDDEVVRLGVQTLSNEDKFVNAAKKLLKDAWLYDQEMEVASKTLWTRYVPLKPGLKPQLPAPCPDITYGWKTEIFKDGDSIPIAADDLSQAGAHMRSYEAPHRTIFWPFATGEIKGHKRTIMECRLQNAHDGAVMTRDRLHLQASAGLPIEYERALIFTFEITPPVVSANCHWASLDSNGKVVYWRRRLGSWTLDNATEDEQFHIARRAIRNLVEYGRKTSRTEVRIGLTALQAARLAQSVGTNQAQTVTPVTLQPSPSAPQIRCGVTLAAASHLASQPPSTSVLQDIQVSAIREPPIEKSRLNSRPYLSAAAVALQYPQRPSKKIPQLTVEPRPRLLIHP